VIAILLALAAAAGYGGSDFAAGLASRRASAIRVTLMSEAISVAVVGLALALAAPHPLGLRAVAWGAAAGLGGVTGALALYVGFRHAAFSVAGPLSAVGAAGFSVLAGLLLGERPTALALTGIALALPAIVGVSASTRSAPGPPPDGAPAPGPPPDGAPAPEPEPGAGSGSGAGAGSGAGSGSASGSRSGSRSTSRSASSASGPQTPTRQGTAPRSRERPRRTFAPVLEPSCGMSHFEPEGSNSRSFGARAVFESL
jgi:drug/metabolite transporter (DMT)-like permease